MIISSKEELNKICEDASIDEAAEIISLLEKELEKSSSIGKPGIGLAAPQIGINKKVAIIRMPSSNGNNLNINFVNAQIEKSYGPFVFKEEGCLSFTETINTNRFQEVLITNNLVKPHRLIATGLFGVCCQHEIDHYNGITFHERAVIEATIAKVKIRPNDKCPCSSGKKYKICCKKG